MRPIPFFALTVGAAVVAVAIFSTAVRLDGAPKDMPETNGIRLNHLTRAEENVILHGGTELAFSGEYYDHTGDGVYLCRRCDAPLYESAAKFDSHTGWPSFDREIAGAVEQRPDGRRTEIRCARCGGHLGHVFRGEHFTPRNTRHCVNSLSLRFVPAASEGETRRAIFASGCFWGTEYVFQDAPGVLATTVGYTGGHTASPTYREVCGKGTGHAEAVEVLYDPARTTYEALARLFFETHDPTQVDRQGPDVGDQYRSAIFYVDMEQKRIAEKLIDALEAKGYDVATEVVPAGTFWPAEDYHQDYYQKTGGQPYCHGYTRRF